MPWYHEFLHYLKTFANRDANIAIACSGGADSIFLAYSLASIFPKNKITGIIINHNLQANSAIVAQKTQETLAKFGIKSEILVWNHEELQTGIEEKARIARYELIENFCIKAGIETVFLGHRIDDKIETFFMNAARGCGLAGLSSMKEFHKMGKITYIRPMVHSLEKRQILEFLTSKSIQWFEDVSNQNTNFTRNKFRKNLQLTSREKQGIIATILGIEAVHLQQIVCIRNVIESKSTQKNLSFCIPIEALLSISQIDFRPAMLLIIFEKIYRYQLREIRQKSIDYLHSWLGNDSQKSTFANCVFLKKNGILQVFPEYQRLEKINCIADKEVSWNGLCQIIPSLDGTIIPLGKICDEKRKSLQIKEKFLEVAHLPVIISGEKISVPHLNILEFDVKVV